ncbi:hypothetical protein C8R44DRAFT_252620 [Mycena epipterygia]|nr:hypothetical protein C8R44DRAFT_252620 [Mycena epipterygia]
MRHQQFGSYLLARSQMANVLADHPELASGVLEVVSNALTASQQQVVDLEHKVADLEQRLVRRDPLFRMGLC